MSSTKELKYIVIETMNSNTNETRTGILDSYIPTEKAVKIIDAHGMVSYIRFSLCTIITLAYVEDTSSTEVFFTEEEQDQNDAIRILNMLSIRYGKEGTDGEIRLSDCYTDIPDLKGTTSKIKSTSDSKTGSTTATGSSTNKIKETIVSSQGSGVKAANPVTTATTAKSVVASYPAKPAGPALITNLKPLDKNTLQDMKSLVEQLNGNLEVVLPDLDGGVDLQPRNKYNASHNVNNINNGYNSHYGDDYGYCC